MSRTCKTCGDIGCPYKEYHWSTGCICYTPKSSLQRELEELKDFDYKKRAEQIDRIYNIELKADLLEIKFLSALMQRKKEHE